MSMFPSSLAAVQAAVAIQRELARAGRAGSHRRPRRRGDRRAGAAHGRRGEHRRPDRVVRRTRRRDAVRLGVRADQEPERRRRRAAWGGSGSRTSGARSSSTPCRPTASWCRMPGALEGKGERFASLPSNLPDPALPLVGRARRPRVARRARPRASGGHDHRSRRSRQDARPHRARPAARSPSSWTVSRSSRSPTSPTLRSSSRRSRTHST